MEIIYLSLHCHHQNDFCIKMGSDESHFNVSVGSDGQSHKTVSTNHNLFRVLVKEKIKKLEMSLSTIWSMLAHVGEKGEGWGEEGCVCRGGRGGGGGGGRSVGAGTSCLFDWLVKLV